MNPEIDKVEARQGDRRRMNMRVLFWGVPAAVLVLGLLFVLWASP